MVLRHNPERLDWIGTWLAPLAGPVVDEPRRAHNHVASAARTSWITCGPWRKPRPRNAISEFGSI